MSSSKSQLVAAGSSDMCWHVIYCTHGFPLYALSSFGRFSRGSGEAQVRTQTCAGCVDVRDLDELLRLKE